jgi:hypothetical protein
MLDYAAATGLTTEQIAIWRNNSEECAAATYIPNRAQLETNLAIGAQRENKKKIFLLTR